MAFPLAIGIIGVILVKLEESDNPKAKRILKKLGML